MKKCQINKKHLKGLLSDILKETCDMLQETCDMLRKYVLYEEHVICNIKNDMLHEK